MQALAKAEVSLEDVEWVGIGVPGAVDPETGVIEYSANFGFHNWKIVKMMEERLGKKVLIENITHALKERLSIYPSDVFIVIEEPDLENWGIGGKQK